MRNEYKYCTVMATGMILLFLTYCNFRVIRLTSQSVPFGWCLQLLNVKPKKGDLCVFERNGVKTVKYLVGLPGSRIKNMNDTIYIDANIAGHAKRTKNLTPVSSGFVPDGRAFVAGTHKLSFDSRYEEFGFVNIKDIQGKAIGICKW